MNDDVNFNVSVSEIISSCSEEFRRSISTNTEIWLIYTLLQTTWLFEIVLLTILKVCKEIYVNIIYILEGDSEVKED